MSKNFIYGEKRNRKRKQRMKAYNKSKSVTKSKLNETLSTGIRENLEEGYDDQILDIDSSLKAVEYAMCVGGRNLEEDYGNKSLDIDSSLKAAEYAMCVGGRNLEEDYGNKSLDIDSSLKAAEYAMCVGGRNLEEDYGNKSLDIDSSLKAAVYAMCVGGRNLEEDYGNKSLDNDSSSEVTECTMGVEGLYLAGDNGNVGGRSVLSLGEMEIAESEDRNERLNDAAYEDSQNDQRNEDSFLEPDDEECNKVTIGGRRIVELDFLFHQLKDISYHNSGRCPFYNIEIKKEIRNGLRSKILLQCNTCNKRFSVLMTQDEDTEDTMCLNSTAVLASNMIGIGCSQLEQFASVLDIPVMCPGNFKRLNDKVGKFWEQTAEECMRKAADEERQCAIERGDVDKEDGIPFITVVTDECWGKRSYNKNYTALSGTASIVGAHTGKILWLGVRNKYCVICVRNANKNLEPPSHFCTRNYSGSSSEMEWQSILEGFQKSVDLYNLRYLNMIADGDSSTYCKIVEHKPYRHHHVEKKECSNHIKRNFRKQLEEAVKGCPRGLNKHVCNNLERIRRDLCSAIKFRQQEDRTENEKISLLKSDINNIIYHVFGDHRNCPDYIKEYCKEETNHIPALTACGTLEKLSKVMRKLMYCAKDLLLGATNNVAEHYNSIVAKLVGGKRVNFSLSWSYKYKANAAAVQFNTQSSLSAFYKTKFKTNPSTLERKIEMRRIQKCRRERERRRRLKANKVYGKRFNSLKQSGPGYGANHEDTDLRAEDFANEKAIITNKLTENQLNRVSIEQSTREKYKCNLWYQVGNNMIMASNFGSVCKARVLSGHVKKLSKGLVQTKSITHESESESIALQQLSSEENISIQSCGMFIDETDMCLAGSPTGIVSSGGMIVLIKFPLHIINKDPNDPSVRAKLPFFETNNNQVLGLNKNHDVFYEIQGLLHICKMNVCLFAIWTSSKHKMYVERIPKDDVFFNTKMKARLILFYYDWLLPELADPRSTRSMEVRQPNNS